MHAAVPHACCQHVKLAGASPADNSSMPDSAMCEPVSFIRGYWQAVTVFVPTLIEVSPYSCMLWCHGESNRGLALPRKQKHMKTKKRYNQPNLPATDTTNRCCNTAVV